MSGFNSVNQGFLGGGGNGAPGPATTVPISGLLAATGTNDIDNSNYEQIWRWDSISNSNGLLLSSTGDTSTGASNALLQINLAGTSSASEDLGLLINNSKIGVLSANYGAVVTVGNSGTNIGMALAVSGGGISINTGINITASGGIINRAINIGQGDIYINSGDINILKMTGSVTADGGVISIKPQPSTGTYNFNLPTTAGTAGQVLTSAGGDASPMTWETATSSISNLTDAISTNSISNGGYTQTWDWPDLTDATALVLSSSASTAADSKILEVLSSGSNTDPTASVNYGLYSSVSKLKGGVGSGVNIAGYFSAINGNSGNFAIIVPSGGGNVGFGTSSPVEQLHVVGNSVFTSSATTGNGIMASSSTITTGNLMSLTNTGTAADSNRKNVLAIVSIGANGTASQTVTGQTISVTNTGTTNTNLGLSITATGATTNNYAIYATVQNLGNKDGIILANADGILVKLGSASNSGHGKVSSQYRLHLDGNTDGVYLGLNGVFPVIINATQLIQSGNGGASLPAFSMTGNPYTAGTATTNHPLSYMNGGTAPTTWSTAGTYKGINAVIGFTGNFLDFHINGGASVFSVASNGSITCSGSVSIGTGGLVGINANNSTFYSTTDNGLRSSANA